MAAETKVIPGLPAWHGRSELHAYFVCDVFTSEPLQGNQLGVFVDGRPFTSEEMQGLAREMNFAETVFLLPPKAGGDVSMRIFTPGNELPFAGHPILGTAFVVASALGADAVTLETGRRPRAGQLGSRRRSSHVRTDATAGAPVGAVRGRAGELLDALGVSSSRLPVEVYRSGPSHVFVGLESEQAVAALEPDLGALKRLDVAANCFAGAGRAWKSRMFYPGAGISEDPATGSAAGPLAVHLARHGEIAFGDEIIIRQGVEIGRPSLLHAIATGEGERIDSVEVGGAAMIVAEGRFRIAQE